MLRPRRRRSRVLLVLRPVFRARLPCRARRLRRVRLLPPPTTECPVLGICGTIACLAGLVRPVRSSVSPLNSLCWVSKSFCCSSVRGDAIFQAFTGEKGVQVRVDEASATVLSCASEYLRPGKLITCSRDGPLPRNRFACGYSSPTTVPERPLFTPLTWIFMCLSAPGVLASQSLNGECRPWWKTASLLSIVYTPTKNILLRHLAQRDGLHPYLAFLPPLRRLRTLLCLWRLERHRCLLLRPRPRPRFRDLPPPSVATFASSFMAALSCATAAR